MLFPWIKRASTLGLVLLGTSQSLAQYGGTSSPAVYGQGTVYSSHTYGNSWGESAGYQPQSLLSYPRSPGAGHGLLNGTGRYFGFGYSEGYHSCPTGDCGCASGQCGPKLSGRFGGVGHSWGATNIVASAAPACNGCQTPIPNAPCGNEYFGNYQCHPGNLFGKPSYGNPHYAPDCINWRTSVHYDQGPCVPPTVYQGLPQTPPTQTVPAPHTLQHAAPMSEMSPSDAQGPSWTMPRSLPAPQPMTPKVRQEPTPAVPLSPLPPPTTSKRKLEPVNPPAPADVPLSLPAVNDDALLDEGDNEPKLDLAPKTPAVTAPENPAEPVPALPVLEAPVPEIPAPAVPAPAVPAPAVPAPAVPAPAVPAPAAEDDDEDLLSKRKSPIRQPFRR